MHSNLSRARMVLATLVAAIVLIHFAQHVQRTYAKQGLASGAIGGSTDQELSDPDVRYELIAMYPTESLFHLANRMDFGKFQSHEKMAKVIRDAGLAGHLLATIYLVESQSGRSVYRTYIVHPGRDSYHFPNDQMLMQKLAGRTLPKFPGEPKIVVVPDDLLRRLEGLPPIEIWDRLKAELDQDDRNDP